MVRVHYSQPAGLDQGSSVRRHQAGCRPALASWLRKSPVSRRAASAAVSTPVGNPRHWRATRPHDAMIGSRERRDALLTSSSRADLEMGWVRPLGAGGLESRLPGCRLLSDRVPWRLALPLALAGIWFLGGLVHVRDSW